MVLTHNFSNAEELALILGSIGPPFSDVTARRDVTRDALDNVIAAENSVSANLGLVNGFNDFSDSDLSALLGGTPFGDVLEGRSPSDVMTFDISIAMPESKTGSAQLLFDSHSAANACSTCHQNSADSAAFWCHQEFGGRWWNKLSYTSYLYR